MTLKTLAAAATLAVFATTGVSAATFDFSFDASNAVSGDPTSMAVGTLDINVAPGESFSNSDISDVMIELITGSSSPVLLNSARFTGGTLSADGSEALFIDLIFENEAGSLIGCADISCADGTVSIFNPGTFSVRFDSQAAALASFQATAQVSAVPLPAGGLLLLSGLGGVAALKRRKKRAA